MKPKLLLTATTAPGVEVETIDTRHLPLLRTLKNKHRHRFFHQEEISIAAQQQWYDEYRERADDWMFIVRAASVDSGCVGCRVREGAWDI